MNITDTFDSEKIEYFSAVPLDGSDIVRADICTRRGISPDALRTAIVFLIPYYCRDEREGNISLYARPCDYHAYCDDLFARICPELSSEYGGTFVGFADKSPIEETSLAVRARLGSRGDSYVILNEKYGSFVFIGEILTDNDISVFDDVWHTSRDGLCTHCGACRRACPMTSGHGECLSSLTQKKGELTEDERSYIREYGYAWGCDICQLACPVNRAAMDSGVQTPIEYFRQNRIVDLDGDILSSLDDEEFARRAFSWRGRKTLIRNIGIIG